MLHARGETIRLVKQAVETGGYAIPDTTYRIRLDGQTGLVTSDRCGTRPALPAQPAPLPPRPADDVTVDLNATDDQALERMIESERADKSNPDLLRANAPEE